MRQRKWKIASEIFSSRVVLHVDLDEFFVQVERSLNPTLVGKPMVVQQHADVVAVSYEARELGVTRHMSTATIRERFPSVRLVHVQTVGAQNEKVSYRNYRRAARSIFKLVRAFCSPEEGGAFQRASVGEAYMEPSLKTLVVAEGESLSCPSPQSERQRVNDFPFGGAEDGTGGGSNSGGALTLAQDQTLALAFWTAGTDIAIDRETRDGDSRDGRTDFPDAGDDATGLSGDGDGRGLSGPESSGTGGENSRGRSRSGGCGLGLRTTREEEEEDRLLEAGGLLGKRIQGALKEVLEYDCSIGVATNKFLAKLTTSLAKPRGVRVLRRRDVSRLLSSTTATNLPGCGEGSVPAERFASWGVESVLDLRRVGAAELRAHLGEHMGAKVYDRCRGIDNEPVEPDPAPSQVSSVVSLAPLMKPDIRLGKSEEKATPVFPWEVKRLRPFLKTLADDLVDSIKEEFEERRRRPTKLRVEHHLDQCDSKSQTFVLLKTTPPPLSLDPLAIGHVGGSPQGFPPEEEVVDESADLPLPASLVELALAPFKSYEERRRGGAAMMIGGDEARGLGRGVQEKAGNPHFPEDAMPPVVKLRMSFLEFESVVGPGVEAGQRRLTDIMQRPAAYYHRHDNDEGEHHHAEPVVNHRRRLEEGGDGGPKALVGRDRKSVSVDRVEEEGDINVVVNVGPAPCVALSSPSAPVAQAPTTAATATPTSTARAHSPTVWSLSPSSPSSPSRRTRWEGDEGNLTSPAVAQTALLVRCPRCRACLPLGRAWDMHRDEHNNTSPFERRGEKRGTSSLSAPPLRSLPRGRRMTAPSASPESTDGATTVEVAAAHERSFTLEEIETGDESGDVVVVVPGRSSAVGAPGVRGPAGAGDRERLSDLLRLAVTPDQAADALRERGLLPADGWTRFTGFSRGTSWRRQSQSMSQSPSYSTV